MFIATAFKDYAAVRLRWCSKQVHWWWYQWHWLQWRSMTQPRCRQQHIAWNRTWLMNELHVHQTLVQRFGQCGGSSHLCTSLRNNLDALVLFQRNFEQKSCWVLMLLENIRSVTTLMGWCFECDFEQKSCWVLLLCHGKFKFKPIECNPIKVRPFNFVVNAGGQLADGITLTLCDLLYKDMFVISKS